MPTLIGVILSPIRKSPSKECTPLNCLSSIQNLPFAFLIFTFALSNYSVRPRQHIRRNRQADLLRSFQVDDQLELLRLLDGQVGGLGAFENLVHEVSGAPE